MTGPSPEPEAWVVWGTSRGRNGSPEVLASHGSDLPAPLQERPDIAPEESVFVGCCEGSSMPGFDSDAQFSVERRDRCWYLWHTVIEFVEIETADPDLNDDEDQDEDEDQRDTWVDVEPIVTGEDCVAACRWPGVPKETVAEVLFSKVARLILQGDRRVAGAGMDFFKGDAEIGIAGWNRAKAELAREHPEPTKRSC